MKLHSICINLRKFHMKQSFVFDKNLTNTKTQQTVDELDALTGVDEHLQFTAKFIQTKNIPNEVNKEIQQRINYIQKRRNDSNLYLAVIGEFSSGKSTFINALLRDDLLKTSALPTTAAATKLRYSNDLQVEVRLRGSSDN
jgi:ribosome biogenesis GTPase A